MTAAAQLAERVLAVAGTALLHGTLLAAAAWLLSVTLLRRARPAAIVALWTVVLLKFLVPVGPGAHFSLASMVADVTADEPAAAEVVVVTAPAPGARLAPAVAPPVAWGSLALGAAWFGIALALAGRQVRRARAARRRALEAAPAPTWLTDEVRALGRRLGMRRRVALRVSDTETSPYLVGLAAPIIVVPATLLEQPEARRAVLAHELAHVRRGDAALRLVQAAAATLFFFYPVVRFVNRRIDLAREQACDAWAVAVGPLSARAYARMLVDAARANVHPPTAGLALIFPFGRGAGHLRRRVDALCARSSGSGAGVGAAGALAVALFAALGLTGAAADAAPPVRPKVCLFTPEVASSIMASFPEADIDGDGALSRDEVCDFQQVMRKRVIEDGATLAPAEALALASVLDEGSPLASDELCCNCPDPSAPGGVIAPDTVELSYAIPTCSRGVDP